MRSTWKEILELFANIIQVASCLPLLSTVYRWVRKRGEIMITKKQIIVVIVVGVLLFVAGYILHDVADKLLGPEKPVVTIDLLPDPIPKRVDSVHGTYEGIANQQLWLVVHHGTGYHVQPGPATLLADGSWDHPAIDIFPDKEAGTFVLRCVKL